MFVGVVGDREENSVEPTTSRGELMVTVHGSGVWQPKTDSDEDVEKREWKSGLGTPVGLRHPHPILVIFFMMRGCT
jgi:hypothetical protein